MRFFGKRTARQKEIRRSKAERRLAWYNRIAEQLQFQPFTYLCLSATLAALVVNFGEDRVPYRLGETLPRAVTSRVTFLVQDERLTQVMRMRARDSAPDYYTLDASLLQDVRGRLASALRIAREQAADPQKLRDSAAQISVVLDDAGLEELMRLAATDSSTVFQQALEHAMQVLARQPLVEADDIAHRRTGINAVLVDPEQSTERPTPSDRLLYSNNREHVTAVATAAATPFPEPLRASIRDSLLRILGGQNDDSYKPLYRHDTARSTKAALDAENAVPIQYMEFAAGTRLVDAEPLSADGLKLLKQEDEEFRALRSADPRLRRAHQLASVSRSLLAFLVAFGVGGYITLAQERGRSDPRRRIVTAVVLLFLLLVARAVYLNAPYVHLAVGVHAFAITLLAITARRGPAYAGAWLLAALIALSTRQGVNFFVTLVVVSLVLFVGLRDVRNRGRIIAVGVLAAVAAVATTQLAGLIDNQPFTYAFWNDGLWAGLTVLAAAFIVEGILPGIERLFGVTTNMTLLEWCDPNKPLLRMLAAESPGTYNHSLLVGTLADAAAEAIDANGLLARTGAYYHDIGKVNKPEYFVENQAMGVGSRHERLSPAMSHLIIIGHVKDGIEMAREYHLPENLRSFIPEHHGTCVVEYFYHAANQARKPGDPEVDDEQFRYPGPKPQSRETAIVMLCDAVEGAVRAMSEPTPNRIEDTVEKIIQKRLMDGQFDECDLTFRELSTIRDSLVKTLSSIYHGRIVYPGDEGESRHAS